MSNANKEVINKRKTGITVKESAAHNKAAGGWRRIHKRNLFLRREMTAGEEVGGDKIRSDVPT